MSVLFDVNHIIEGRMNMVRVKAHGVKVSVFNCYCPSEQYAESTKQPFYQTPHKEGKNEQKRTKWVKTNNPSFKVIIAGDFNATIGMDCDPSKWHSISQLHDTDPTSFNGSRLIETVETSKLFLPKTLFAFCTN